MISIYIILLVIEKRFFHFFAKKKVHNFHFCLQCFATMSKVLPIALFSKVIVSNILFRKAGLRLADCFASIWAVSFISIHFLISAKTSSSKYSFEVPFRRFATGVISSEERLRGDLPPKRGGVRKRSLSAIVVLFMSQQEEEWNLAKKNGKLPQSVDLSGENTWSFLDITQLFCSIGTVVVLRSMFLYTFKCMSHYTLYVYFLLSVDDYAAEFGKISGIFMNGLFYLERCVWRQLLYIIVRLKVNIQYPKPRWYPNLVDRIRSNFVLMMFFWTFVKP